MSSDPLEKEFQQFKKDSTIHGLLMGLSFLVILPAGTLVTRYLRTFTRRWLLAHWIINGLIGFHLILAAAYMGWKSHKLSHLSLTAHGKRGLFIIGMTIGQLVLGLIIHYTRINLKIRFFGHRPPQNFIHALQGLIILGLANYQVHDGIYTRAPLFLAADVRKNLKYVWLAFVVIFWSLYAIGLAFLRRQYAQEREARQEKDQEAHRLRSSTTPP